MIDDTPPEELEPVYERDQVLGWRIVMFVDLGYSTDEAIRLAHLDVDHHDLERLVRNGCPLPTAVTIVA